MLVFLFTAWTCKAVGASAQEVVKEVRCQESLVCMCACEGLSSCVCTRICVSNGMWRMCPRAFDTLKWITLGEKMSDHDDTTIVRRVGFVALYFRI